MQSSEQIRQLLRRYYDGSASADEIKILEQFFCSDAPVEPDMEVDLRIFRALAEAPQVKAPASLTERVNRIAEEPKRSRRSLLMRLAAASVAAAAAIALIITFKSAPTGNQSGTPIDSSALVAAATEEIPAETTGTADSAATEQPIRLTAAPTKTKKAKTNRRKAAKRTAPAPKKKLTDKELRGIRMTVELFNRSLLKADIACAKVDESFMEIENSLNNIDK